jgi:hypothetical protein
MAEKQAVVCWDFAVTVHDEDLAITTAQNYQQDELGLDKESADRVETLEDAVQLACELYMCSEVLDGVTITQEAITVTLSE